MSRTETNESNYFFLFAIFHITFCFIVISTKMVAQGCTTYSPWWFSPCGLSNLARSSIIMHHITTLAASNQGCVLTFYSNIEQLASNKKCIPFIAVMSCSRVRALHVWSNHGRNHHGTKGLVRPTSEIPEPTMYWSSKGPDADC